MPTKLNITTGPWTYKMPKLGKFYAKISGGTWEKFAKVTMQTKDDFGKITQQPEGEANLLAIVTAVNNTYHKGINPEAVPDMLEVLNEISEQCFSGSIINYSKLLSVIRKATL